MAVISTHIQSLYQSLRSRRQTINSVAVVTGGQGITAALSIVGGLVQARYIAPEILGYYSAFAILGGYLTFLHLGSLTALQREYPYWLGKGDLAKANASAAVTQGWILLVCTAMSALYLSLSAWSLVQGNWLAAAGWASQLIAAAGGFYTLYLGCTYRSTSEFVTWSKISVVGAVLSFVSLFLVVWLGYWGMCLRALVGPAITLYILHRLRPLHVNPSFHFRALWQQVKFGLPMDMAGFLATSCMAATLSTLVLGKYGAATLGLFAFARVAEGMMQQLGVSITQVFLPRISMRMGQTESLRECAIYAIKATVPCTLAVAVMTLMAAVLCRPAVMFLAPKYEGAISLMQVFLWVGLHPVLMLPRQVLVAGKKTWLLVTNSILTFVVFACIAWGVIQFDMSANWMAVAYMAGKLFNALACGLSVWYAIYSKRNDGVSNESSCQAD